MEQKILSSEPRRSFSNEFKLQMVKLASQPGASVARIAREHDINDNLLFKWLRLCHNQEPLLPVLPGNTISMITSCSNGSGSGRTKGVYRGVFR
nr:transposase [Escherichia coli]